MTCQLCKEFREKYPLERDEDHNMIHVLERNEDGTPGITSDAIVCAFENFEEFSTHNWCCETMALLRAAVDSDEQHPFWHNDSNIGILPIPLTYEEDDEKIQQGILVMSWYKHRGRTGRAMVFWDNDEPKILTLKTALFIIDKIKQKT